MATINRNWTAYAVVKVIRNWIEYDLWVVTQEEYDALLEQLWVTQEELDKALADLATAQSDLATARTQITTLQSELEEANKRANIDVQYTSWAIYNWDWNYEYRSWTDSYYLIYSWNIHTQAPITYPQVLRFDNWNKYVFGWFLPIAWASKASSSRTYISPFEYYVIDKSTNKITRARGWVSTISTYFWWVWTSYIAWDCLTPTSWWIEYLTEYRNYYYRNNYSKNYWDRNGNIAWYFYIKKDLSAMGYVSADDTSQFTRNQYWCVTTDYNTEWNQTYPHEWTDLFSDYNTNKVGTYDSSNVRFWWKLYTPFGYHMMSNSWNDWYQYLKVYTVRL